MNKFLKATGIVFAVIIFTAACVPAVAPEAQVVHPATPTPEVFNPLNPSPTPLDSKLPLTCQETDLNVYINKEWGYCFAFPASFTLDASLASDGMINLYGPALDDSLEPIRVSLEITTQLVPDGSALTPLVDAYLMSFHDVPWQITREPLMLGSEPGERLEPIPGLLSSRVMMALHNNMLFTMQFHPVEVKIAKPDLDALSQTIIGSFAFFPITVQPTSQLQTVSWFEFGRNISLSYNSILAPWVEAGTIPAVPFSDQILFAESHPAYAQFGFLGFQGGRAYDLPLLPLENRVARVMIFQTTDFPGFGDDSPQGFVNQQMALTNLLKTAVESDRCAQPFTGYDRALPFLPWINMQQSFCAQPQLLEFANGKGIRYLSYYAQGPSPALDQQIFYTFQGLTDDGQFYVSALFPIQTGIFPTEPPPCPKCGEPDYDPVADWMMITSEQLTQLNAQPEDRFAPSLTVLDELIQTIQIGE